MRHVKMDMIDGIDDCCQSKTSPERKSSGFFSGFLKYCHNSHSLIHTHPQTNTFKNDYNKHVEWN